MNDFMVWSNLLSLRRWWFFASIVWHVFDSQESDMFGHYGDIVVRVPLSVAWGLAFRETAESRNLRRRLAQLSKAQSGGGDES